jgi:hypothetical protein
MREIHFSVLSGINNSYFTFRYKQVCSLKMPAAIMYREGGWRIVIPMPEASLMAAGKNINIVCQYS